MTEKWKTLDEVRASRPMTPERAAAIEAGVDELRAEIQLHALRERRGVTQAALAEQLSVSRPRVSAIEHSPALNLATVQRYVEALGGHLKLTAVFDDGEEIELHDAA